jgi:hypothetical protein
MMRTEMDKHWFLVVAEQGGRLNLSSLIGIGHSMRMAYCRYWCGGRVPVLDRRTNGGPVFKNEHHSSRARALAFCHS